ncbi:lipid-A-disaccharide synthase [Cognatishimia sp.]|uniref:lipid-A-disaccharide synthase n=1 Tax=Cognatishimia sp. TaxID=2211648 RepID=UPI003513DFAD
MKIYLIAGELSGDRLGAALMAGLQTLSDDKIEFRGVGGPLMAEAGLSSQFPMNELSVMGIAEVLPKYFHLKRRIRECAEAVLEWQPDVLITIDSPDFCLRVAKLVRERSDIRTVHYVAPSVWAWRPKRAVKMAQHIDHVLALLPFEPPYMEAEGMRCDFVGHPVVNEALAPDEAVAQLRDGLAGVSEDPVVLVLPGSRRSEVTRLLPIFIDVMERMRQLRPELRFVLPAAGPVVELVRDLVKDMAMPPTLIEPTGLSSHEAMMRKRAGFQAADAALAASGTVSLELAAAGTPMVIAYDVSWLSRQIFKRMLRIDTVTLVNLVSETRVVPEFIAENCDPAAITQAMLALLDAPKEQADALDLTMSRLGRGEEDPGLRAARAVLDGLGGRTA